VDSGYFPIPDPNNPNVDFPGNPNGIDSSAATELPWPLKTSDLTVSTQPIISDYAEYGGGNSTNISLIPNTEAHFWNGGLDSINIGFADGHAVTHNSHQIQYQFSGNGKSDSYFY
jgi:prepilin-type processing-associated H-X9-DG protein